MIIYVTGIKSSLRSRLPVMRYHGYDVSNDAIFIALGRRMGEAHVAWARWPISRGLSAPLLVVGLVTAKTVWSEVLAWVPFDLCGE
jgi:hypothetical protein